MSGQNSIHMGHGQMVDIAPRGAGEWELVFSQAGITPYQAPPPADVRVEAIDTSGAIHPLAVSPGTSVSTLLAKGAVAGAYRVRVMVMHGDHFHTRESLLPGASAIAPSKGPGGGSMARFPGGEEVEVGLTAEDTMTLRFKGPAPAPDQAVVQAIGPRAEDYQIRNLTTRADTAATLLASGKIKDATYVRVTLKSGGASHTATVPLVR